MYYKKKKNNNTVKMSMRVCTGMWETLLVGSIPVTVSSPLDTLLRRLPVLIVDDWDEVTQQAYL